ncbi:unnamed protein product [Leptosia nina]|uniref:Odorant receptor n=1 Tax=Leptosia nina TaxID=320188 RepID=A0AAV1J151_9NEOP
MTTRTTTMQRPQKYYLKNICNALYYLGVADCWYEIRDVKYPIMRKVYSLIANVFGIIFIANGLAAHFTPDLTFKEKNDLLIYSYGFPAITLKVIIVYVRKEEIKMFLKKLVEDEEFDESAVKAAKLVIKTMIITVYSVSAVQMSVGFKDYFVEDIPIRIEVLFFPRETDTGHLVNTIRVLGVIHFWYMICVMTAVECLCLCALVFIRFKFIRIRVFFEEMEKIPFSSELYEKRFVKGVELYKKTLWCAHNVQKAIGGVYSVQIVESLSLLVIFLLRIIYAGSDMMLFLVSLSSYLFMVLLTGLYMMYSANVSYEALQVPTAVFHCGWENVKIKAGLRKLIVVTLQQSQKQIHMTAFGVINLSYETFITVRFGLLSKTLKVSTMFL